MEENGFGEYIRELRERRRLTLRDVERETGISNGYLSIIERGLRPPPGPKSLQALAKCYGVPPSDLFERAGYLTEPRDAATEEERLSNALEFIRRDPDYHFGNRMPGEMTTEVKRFVVKMYEEMTGKKLLTE